MSNESSETLSLRVLLDDLASAGLNRLRTEFSGVTTSIRAAGTAAGTLTTQMTAATAAARNSATQTQRLANAATAATTATRAQVAETRAATAATQRHGGAMQANAAAFRNNTTGVRLHTTTMREGNAAAQRFTTAMQLATMGVRAHGRMSREASGHVRALGTASERAAVQVRNLAVAAKAAARDLELMGRAAARMAAQQTAAAADVTAAMTRMAAATNMAAAAQERQIASLRRGSSSAGAAGRTVADAYGNGLVSGMRAQAGKLQTVVSKVLSPLTKNAGLLGLAGLAGGGMLAAAGVNRLSTIEDANMAFKTQLGTKAMAREFSTELLSFARTTPFPFQDIAGQARNLMAFGLERDKVIPTLTAAGNSAAAGGSGTMGMNNVAVALGKILSQGQIYADDINSLAVNGVSARAILANHYDVDGPGLRKMMMKGQIGGSEAVDVLVDGIQNGNDGRMGKVTGVDGLMKDMKGTWSGTLSDFKASVTGGMAGVMKDAMPHLQAGIKKFGEGFSALPRIVNRVVDYAKAPLEGLTGIIGGIAAPLKSMFDVFRGSSAPVQAAVIGLAAFALVGVRVAKALQMMSARGRQNWAFASYGVGPLANLRAAMTTTAARARMFGQSFTSSGIAYTRALAAMGGIASGTYLTRSQAIFAGVQRSFTGLVGSVASGARRMGASLMGALGGGWGIAIMAGITALTMWIGAQGRAAEAERMHQESLRSLADTMNSFTGATTEATVAKVAKDWEDQGLNDQAVALGLDPYKLQSGILNGGIAGTAATDSINQMIAGKLEETHSWKTYGDTAKAAGITAADVLYATQTDQAFLLNRMRSGIEDRFPGLSGAYKNDAVDRVMAGFRDDAIAASTDYQPWLDRMKSDTLHKVEAQSKRINETRGIIQTAMDAAKIESPNLRDLLTDPKNQSLSINEIMGKATLTGDSDGFWGQDPVARLEKEIQLTNALTDVTYKSEAGAFYLSKEAAAAADAAIGGKKKSIELTDEQIEAQKEFMDKLRETKEEQKDWRYGLDEDAQKLATTRLTALAQSPYVKMYADIADSMQSAIDRADIFRQAMDQALGIDRSSEDLAVDYAAGKVALAEVFKGATEKTGGNVESVMGKEGDLAIDAEGDAGVAARDIYAGLANFRKLTDAKILDAFDQAGGLANYDVALKAMQTAQQQGAADFMAAAATQGIDPGYANALQNRDYDRDGGVDRHLVNILPEADVAAFIQRIEAAGENAALSGMTEIEGQAQEFVAWMTEQNLAPDVDLNTLPALAANEGLRKAVAAEIHTKMQLEAIAWIKLNVAGATRPVDGGYNDLPMGQTPPKKRANGGFEKHDAAYADGGVRQATIARGGSNILWAENETEDELYVPFAMSKRARAEHWMRVGAARMGGRFTAAGENTRPMASGGLMAAPAYSPTPSGGGGGSVAVTIAPGAISVVAGPGMSTQAVAAEVMSALRDQVEEIFRENDARSF